MKQTIYVEHQVANHPRTLKILQRYPNNQLIYCDRYSEIFNRKAQNFRLQKTKPAIILAKKTDAWVLSAPDGYGIGGKHNYYFSHMLNCVYDCRYCFLQGMYRSAHYLVFVNFEDYENDLHRTMLKHATEETWFYSGYDCDSLAFDPITGFSDFFLPFFENTNNAWLELRTKSTQIRSLLSRTPVAQSVVAFSFTPQAISNHLEKGVPSVEKRLVAMKKLFAKGWKLGLRLDPLIYCDNFELLYKNLLEQIFCEIPGDSMHSVSIGTFRTPKPFFNIMKNLYPEEKLFAGSLVNQNGMITYRSSIEEQLIDFCINELSKYVAPEKFFTCTPEALRPSKLIKTAIKT